MREGMSWSWVVLSGVVTLPLGAMILAHWPVSSLFVLGVLLGVDLIIIGYNYKLHPTCVLRKAVHTAEPRRPPRYCCTSQAAKNVPSLPDLDDIRTRAGIGRAATRPSDDAGKPWRGAPWLARRSLIAELRNFRPSSARRPFQVVTAGHEGALNKRPTPTSASMG